MQEAPQPAEAKDAFDQALEAIQPKQVYCDDCGFGLDHSLEGPYCQDPGHLEDGPNGTRGRHKDFKEFLGSSIIREPFALGPRTMTKRAQKRATQTYIKRVNRAIRRQMRREEGAIIGCAPSEKAQARADLREAERLGCIAEGED